MTPEGAIQRTITDFLTAKGIWWMRLNTGAMKGSHKGKSWFVRFAKPGTGDIICTPWITRQIETNYGIHEISVIVILWLEIKTEKGRLSNEQVMFKAEVEAQGHYYLMARSHEDVIAWFSEYDV